MANAVIRYVEIDSVTPNPNQPRKTFDQNALTELSESVKQLGILQPILVEELQEGGFRIIAGERRYRAAKLAGLAKVPVIVQNLQPLERLEVSVVENIQREDLNPIEEAYAYLYLIQNGGLSQEEVAEKVAKSRSTIANSLRLIKLSTPMREALSNNVISQGHARALLSVANPAERDMLFDKIVKDQLSVREAERLAQHYQGGGRATGLTDKEVLKGKTAGQIHDTQTIDEVFSSEKALMAEAADKISELTKLRWQLSGTLKRGKLFVTFNSTEQLEGIYKMLGGDGLLFPEEE